MRFHTITFSAVFAYMHIYYRFIGQVLHCNEWEEHKAICEYTYVRTEINANVFTPLSIQFDIVSATLLCPDIGKACPCFMNTKLKNGEENDDTTCSISGQYQIWHRRVSAIIA